MFDIGNKARHGLLVAICTLVAGLFSGLATAEPQPSSDLLLPYFEIDLVSGPTTLMAVVNSHEERVTAEFSVYSNWGVRLLVEPVDFGPDQVVTVNLADWVLRGQLPSRQLSTSEIAHLQAALTGQASPEDGLYYGEEAKPDLAVGYVEVHVRQVPRRKTLWGDYFIVDPTQDYAQGDVLVNIDRTTQCPDLCRRHGLRFLQGGGFDGGSQILIWTGRRGLPRQTPSRPVSATTSTEAAAYDERGNHLVEREMNLLSTQAMALEDLDLPENFGWLDLVTDTDVFMAVRYSANDRFSVGLVSHCLPPEEVSGPQVRIEKLTNGEDADQAPGPALVVGDPVTWSYLVRNAGGVRLDDVTVTDDQGVSVACPSTRLEVGESMTCTGTGFAQACQYRNVGTVTGTGPDGAQVQDADPSHYFGGGVASISLEKSTNGEDADQAPGPSIVVGGAVHWSYRVTNTGEVTLAGISVSDDQGVSVSCPQTSLAPGESMTCTGNGAAVGGQYRNIGTVTAASPCGDTVTAQDPSHYYGICSEQAGVTIEKSTNGEDADVTPGPEIEVGDPVTWTYVVTNVGNSALSQVAVSDDQGVAVSCPRTALAPGESMSCTGSGIAVVGQYRNLGSVSAITACGASVTDSDPSHYFGVEESACSICDGKVTELTFQFLGASTSHVRILAKRGPTTDEVFNSSVAAGGIFTIVGPPTGNGGFAGTLGTEIHLYVDGILQTTLHTSCSTPIGPGLISGDFLVLEGYSRNGGLLCPVA